MAGKYIKIHSTKNIHNSIDSIDSSYCNKRKFRKSDHIPNIEKRIIAIDEGNKKLMKSQV